VGPGDPRYPSRLDEFRLIDLPFRWPWLCLPDPGDLLYQALDPFDAQTVLPAAACPPGSLLDAAGPADGLGSGRCCLAPSTKRRQNLGPFDALLGLTTPFKSVAGYLLLAGCRAVGTAAPRSAAEAPAAGILARPWWWRRPPREPCCAAALLACCSITPHQRWCSAGLWCRLSLAALTRTPLTAILLSFELKQGTIPACLPDRFSRCSPPSPWPICSEARDDLRNHGCGRRRRSTNIVG